MCTKVYTVPGYTHDVMMWYYCSTSGTVNRTCQTQGTTRFGCLRFQALFFSFAFANGTTCPRALYAVLLVCKIKGYKNPCKNIHGPHSNPYKIRHHHMVMCNREGMLVGPESIAPEPIAAMIHNTAIRTQQQLS